MREKLWVWLAWHMPRKLAYWCTMRLIAHATSGKYGDTLVPGITAIDVLTRWDK